MQESFHLPFIAILASMYLPIKKKGGRHYYRDVDKKESQKKFNYCEEPVTSETTYIMILSLPISKQSIIWNI